MENGGFWKRRASTTKSRTYPQKLVDPTQTTKSRTNSMKSTELHSDSVIQQGESIPTAKIGQVKKNKKSGIVTFPASSPLTDWTAKHKKSSSGLPTEPDGAKLKPDENAGKMNFVSNFATDPSYFPLPESGVVIERIEQLETRYKLNHTEIAKEIGISRGTVHAVLKGRAPTQKLVRKLDAAEKRLEASTLQTPSTNKSMLVFAMNRAIPEEVQTGPNQVFVRPKGTDGNTYPDGTIINLTSPPLIKGIGGIVRAHTEDRCNDLIKICLPKELADDKWIENMSPTSYLSALKKAVILILGPTWKAEFAKIIADTEAQNTVPATPDQESEIWPGFRPDPNPKPFPTTTMPEGLK